MRETLGNVVKNKRETMGFKSQRALSAKAGVSNATIARIENGEQVPLPKTLKKISIPLMISYQELLQVAGYLENEIQSKEALK